MLIDADTIQRPRRRKMAVAAARKLMTVDEFLYEFDGVEGRWELAHGVPVMMAGGGIHHGRVARNILTLLAGKLRGSGCQPFGSDVGVQIDIRQYRLPDVSVLCDPRDTEVDELQRAHFPKVLFEVFSPSTTETDRGTKLLEYRRLPSVEAIVHIDPVTEEITVYERTGPRDWKDRTLSAGEDLALPAIGAVLTREDLFRRD